LFEEVVAVLPQFHGLLTEEMGWMWWKRSVVTDWRSRLAEITAMAEVPVFEVAAPDKDGPKRLGRSRSWLSKFSKGLAAENVFSNDHRILPILFSGIMGPSELE
jgi:hypothetical protein